MIAACLKFTAPPGHELDDDRFAGISPADRAALEIALRLADVRADHVMVVAAGPRAADRMLRAALACGAATAIRIDSPPDRDSRDTAFELAEAVRGADVVVCGDYSLDRGSGSVPAFIAHRLSAAQALGLVSLDPGHASARSIRAVRRLDGGRREVLDVPVPCVISVEGSVASLRRASLRRALQSADAVIESRPAAPAHHAVPAVIVTPFRPRARTLAAPAAADVLGRLRLLTDALGTPAHGETIELAPRASAERILAALHGWGYLT
ncbi:MAG: hypothetical protein RLZZ623_1301 [Actinomycetota bacterium]|jgi:electron transfer flavoprotein beta subunit